MAKADLARSRARFAPFLLFAFAATTACEDKVPANLVSQKPNALQRVVGVAEVTLHDLNSPIPGTPFSALRKADGSTVSNPFAHQVTATALTALSGSCARST